MLELRNIYKSFGDARVLGGVDFRLENGFVYTLMGGNGSGKATLVNIISGFLKPDEGCVKLKGKIILQIEHYPNYIKKTSDNGENINRYINDC